MTVTGADDAGPYLQCIGLKTGWYKAGGWSKGRKGIFRSSGDNLLGCIIKSETWCPSRREVEDEEEEEEEEIVDIETRGLFPKKYLEPLKDCLGSIRNKFLTEVKDLSGFGRCLRQLCPSYTDSVIKGTASCLNLTPGEGPGPNCDYHDFWNKEKMMIQNNRGKLGFCIREQRTKCQLRLSRLLEQGEDDDPEQQRKTRILYQRTENEMSMNTKGLETKILYILNRCSTL